MTLWILDTDIVSLFQQRNPLVMQRVRAIAPQELAVTIITVEEQMLCSWKHMVTVTL